MKDEDTRSYVPWFVQRKATSATITGKVQCVKMREFVDGDGAFVSKEILEVVLTP